MPACRHEVFAKGCEWLVFGNVGTLIGADQACQVDDFIVFVLALQTVCRFAMLALKIDQDACHGRVHIRAWNPGLQGHGPSSAVGLHDRI